MRLIETCSCGASIEVIYSTKDAFPRGTLEQEQAQNAVNTWRERHNVCTPPKAAPRIPPSNPHDQEVASSIGRPL